MADPSVLQYAVQFLRALLRRIILKIVNFTSIYYSSVKGGDQSRISLSYNVRRAERERDPTPK